MTGWDWRELLGMAREGLSLLSDVLGVFSVIIGLIVYGEVKALRTNVLARARLPKHKETLKEYASALSTYLSVSAEHPHEINKTMAELDATLSDMTAMTSGGVRDQIRQLQGKVQKFRSAPPEPTAGWTIHSEVNGLIVRLGDAVANAKVVP